MLDFLQLPLQLQEQIVSKVLWKSYFRIQQTCKYMEELIRTNRYVKMSVPAVITPNEDDFLGYVIARKKQKRRLFYDIDWDPLKEYRISSKLFDITGKKDLSDERFKELLKILKPERVKADWRGKKMEILLGEEQLTDLEVSVCLQDLRDLSIIGKLLEKLHNLKIEMSRSNLNFNIRLATRILQEPLPNLRSFYYKGYHIQRQMPFPTEEELKRTFDAFDPIFLDTEIANTGQIFGYRFECRVDDRLCQLEMTRQSTEIRLNCPDDDQPFMNPFRRNQ